MSRKKNRHEPQYDEEFDEELPKSKSQIKREMESMQVLGEQLVKMTESLLHEVPLDETLKHAIMQARTMKHREGYRRQMQYIGKLMRAADVEAIEATLHKQSQKDAEQVHFLHLAETWRDRILEEGDSALNTFMNDYADADRQYLRQILRAANKDKKENKPPANARKLFKYLRDIISTNE